MQVMPLFCLFVLGFHDFLCKMALGKSCAAPEFFADIRAASGLPHDKRFAALRTAFSLRRRRLLGGRLVLQLLLPEFFDIGDWLFNVHLQIPLTHFLQIFQRRSQFLGILIHPFHRFNQLVCSNDLFLDLFLRISVVDNSFRIREHVHPLEDYNPLKKSLNK